MKYFIDTVFKEYHKQHKVLVIKVGYPTPTIDLISIGIVAEDGRSYYALNKDCDLKEVWNDKWLRENVLMPIYTESVNGDNRNDLPFNYLTMKWIFENIGKSKERIANQICEFIDARYVDINRPEKGFIYPGDVNYKLNQVGTTDIEFYGYYADYDWVVFCQLFGKMMDLPKGFPMYCKDLKQMLDDKAVEWGSKQKGIRLLDNKEQLEYLKKQDKYPKQINEHNALDDAKWNLKLYKFIQEL